MSKVLYLQRTLFCLRLYLYITLFVCIYVCTVHTGRERHAIIQETNWDNSNLNNDIGLSVESEFTCSLTMIISGG